MLNTLCRYKLCDCIIYGGVYMYLLKIYLYNFLYTKNTWTFYWSLLPIYSGINMRF